LITIKVNLFDLSFAPPMLYPMSRTEPVMNCTNFEPDFVLKRKKILSEVQQRLDARRGLHPGPLQGSVLINLTPAG
jgi:hypothetical protein